MPLGAMLALPSGEFVTIKDAPPDPLQDIRAKEHFLQNLDSLKQARERADIPRYRGCGGNGCACALETERLRTRRLHFGHLASKGLPTSRVLQ